MTTPRPSPFCGRDDEHPAHDSCRGVMTLPDCDKPWSQHPRYNGQPFCFPPMCNAEALRATGASDHSAPPQSASTAQERGR